MDGTRKFLTMILCLLILPSANNAIAECDINLTLNSVTPIWSDNFSDNASLDDWVVLGYDPGTAYSDEGKFEIIEGALVATGNQSVRNAAFHNSSVAFGTWCFDLFIQDTDFEGVETGKYITEINLISSMDPSDPTDETGDGLRVAILHGDDPILYLNKGIRIYEQGQGPFIFYSQIIEKLRDFNQQKWFHFDITRYTSGMLYVNIDGSEVIGVKTDETIASSEIFSYFTVTGGKMDNVSIYDSVAVDYHAPKFAPLPPNQEVEMETDFRYDVNATDDTDIFDWSIDDTVNFEIDSDGVITNLVALDLGAYDIEVTVADEYGNSISAEFTLTVVEASGLPIPVEMFLGTLILIPIIRRKLKK